MTNIIELTSEQEVDHIIETNEKVILFKAGTCWITTRAWDILMSELEAFIEIPVGFINVVRNRSASTYLAVLTDIRHESPQIIIIQGKKVLFDKSNLRINKKELSKVLNQYFLT